MTAPEDPATKNVSAVNFDSELRTVQQDAQSLCTRFAAETEMLRQTLANPALSRPERQRAVNQTRTVTLQLVNRMTGFLSKLTDMAR